MTTWHEPFASAEEAALFARVEELARQEVEPRAEKHEERGEYPRDLIGLLGENGLLGLPFDPRWGGGGRSYAFFVRVLERLAHSWLAVAESVHVQALAAHAVQGYGSDALREELLPGLCAGRQLGGTCMSEAEAGSDLAAITTRAEPDGDGYRVTGAKAWVTHGGIADFYNVYCRTKSGPASGLGGLSCFVVDATAVGVRASAPIRKMGVKALPTAEVYFDRVRVPATRMLGRRDRGMLVAASVFDHGRLGISACAVGLAQAAVDYVCGYARRPRSSGHPLFADQGYAFQLADLHTRVAAARALLTTTARAKDQGAPSSGLVAACKLFATDTAMAVTSAAVHLMGEDGASPEHPVERWMREAKLLQIIEGTNQIQRVAVASTL